MSRELAIVCRAKAATNGGWLWILPLFWAQKRPNNDEPFVFWREKNTYLLKIKIKIL